VIDGVFLQLGLVVILAAAAAYILRLFRQPQILAYVIVGILITPVFQIITDTSIVESMSIVGIAFLLFIVGLEMDLKLLKSVALVSSLGGLIQTVIIAGIGYLVALSLGFMSLQAAYIGLMLSFSSTMVVMKLLSDKKELNTLHGRLAVGILLMQDIVAILALSFLSSINDFSWTILATALLKFGLLFGAAFIASKYLFPFIFRFSAKNQELLLINSLAVCFLFSLAFYYLDFSIAIGAFIAGISLGNLQYNYEIISKVKSLKDFFSLLFFVSLGMGISISVIKNMWIPLLVIMLLIMVIKPFIIMAVCSIFRYTKKPSFMTANSLAQIGEFSLILVAEGLALGHVSQELFSLTVIATLASIVLTTYYIQYNQFFYRLMQKPLSIFDVFTTEGMEYLPTEVKPAYVLCGHNRIGYSILRDLHKVKKKVLVVDYNPEVINDMVKKGYHCIYGEVTDDEIIDRMNLPKLKILISTIPDTKATIYLLERLKAVNKKAAVFVSAKDVDEALYLYEKGADYVILPHFLGGEHVSGLITNLRNKKLDLKKEVKKHLEHLHERKGLGHDHPKEH